MVELPKMVEFIASRQGNAQKVDQNRNGDCLGDFLHVKVGLDVFQPLRGVLFLRLPNSERVEVDLLYEKLHAYCFLYGCFNHIGSGCHCYDGGTINPFKASYGSWLQG